MGIIYFRYLFFSFLILNILLVFSPCYASGWKYSMEDLTTTPPPSPNVPLKNDARSKRSNTIIEVLPLEEKPSKPPRNRSEQHINGKKNYKLFLETEEQLLIPHYIKMTEEKFIKLSKSELEKAQQIILKIIIDKDQLTHLLNDPGWPVKLACHPTSALYGLSEKHNEMLSKKDNRYLQLLITTVLREPALYEQFFSLIHIPINQIVGAIQENEAKIIDQHLWNFMEHHKPFIKTAEVPSIPSIPYWRALIILTERNHEKAIKLGKNTVKIIEEFLNNNADLPPYFFLLFQTLPPENKKQLFKDRKQQISSCRFKGERTLYHHPHKALHLLEIPASFKDKDAIISLGLYHQHMGEYAKAKTYFNQVKHCSEILCNLGEVHESLGELEEAQKCYENAGPDHLTSAFRLLKLYQLTNKKEEAEKVRNKLKEKLNKPAEKQMKTNTIEAAALSIIFNNPKAALRFINNSASHIDAQYLTPFHAALHILSAYVKHALKKDDPMCNLAINAITHLDGVKSWAQKVLQDTSQNNKEKTSSLCAFSLIIPCVGTYSLEYLAKTPPDDILKKFEEIPIQKE